MSGFFFFLLAYNVGNIRGKTMSVIWTVLSVNCGSKVSITVIFPLPANIPAKKPLRQDDITSQQKRNHSSDERHIGSKSASRYFSFTSSHDTPRASIHPRIESSRPTKHVNSDWVRVCSRMYSYGNDNRREPTARV